jgi:DNA primase
MHNPLRDKVLEATDLVEIVSEHVSLQRRGKEFVGLCPFHADHSPSLHVNPAKQIFKCFACGAGGDAIKFLQLREKLGYRDALALLARRAGINLHVSEADRAAEASREQIRRVLDWARTHFQRNLASARGATAIEYALRRGLTRETIEQFRLGMAVDRWDDVLLAAGRAGVSPELLRQAGLVTANEAGKTYDRFRNRLVFPICDNLGRPVAFGGRTLGEDPAKYLNSPETALFSKSRVLYGLDVARRAIGERNEVVVVEGYMDAVMLHQCGFGHVVATLGTAMTDAHVKLLRGVAERLFLCFDSDQAGVRAADRAVEVSLLGGVEVRVVMLEGAKDPADLVVESGATAFERALAKAVDALEFKWLQTVRAFSDGGLGSRRAAVESLLEFIANVSAGGGSSPLEHGLLVRRLSELLALPPNAIYETLAARRRSRTAARRETVAAGEDSPYGAAIRGLPAGLVAASEEALGLLLADGRCATLLNEDAAYAFSLCGPWERLHGIIRDLSDKGPYAQTDVIERCQDIDVCDLVGRSCKRAAGVENREEAFLGVRERIRLELDLLRGEEWGRKLGAEKLSASGDEVFERLRGQARGRDFALAADKYCAARPAS